MSDTVTAALAAVAVGTALLTGCGGGDESAQPDAPATETRSQKAQTTATEPRNSPKGTAIVAGGSEFGEMLFDSNDQAIYIFENDSEDETVCYGECAAAWPPVLTDGEPTAGDGVDVSLLGTIERDDGTTQVTYAGQPLYFYAHEGPGEVLCHNVNLNGGYWWVVGPDGKRLA